MYSSLKRYAPYARAALNTVNAFKRVKSTLKSNRQSKRNSNSSNIVTSQKDVKGSRPKKRNAKLYKKQQRFKNKIKKALAPDRALNVYNETIQAVNWVTPAFSPVTNFQTVVDGTRFMLNMGVGFSSNQNLGYIVGRYRNIEASTNPNATQGVGNTIPKDEFKLQVHSSKLEASITNIATVPVVIDIYECYAARDINLLAYNTPTAAWATLLAELVNNPTDVGTQSATQIINGQTPYDCPNFGKYWGIRKKTRILLPPLNTSEYMLWGGKFTLNGSKFNDYVAVKGISKGLLIIGGIGDNTGITSSGQILRTVVNSTYHFKYEVGEDELPQRPTSIAKIL